MSHIDVTQGSIETLIIDLDDAIDQLTDLSTTSCTFEVKDRAGAVKQAATAIVTYGGHPMRAGCRVDTTQPSLWPSSRYSIYLTFTDNPDTPVVGPFEFSVNP
jgi:hypothetical protein